MTDYLALTLPGGETINPTGIPSGGAGTLQAAIAVGIRLFLIVVIIASFAYIVWAGLNWMRSDGDPQKVQAARTQIVYAIIGLIVSLLSFTIITIFGNILGIELL